MPPIRIGIVGLSISPGSWGQLAHFPRLSISPNYKIVALCNSSVANAEAAIKHFNLSPTTKAYSSYSDLATDPNVDLVVISTRADTHHTVALPALHAGKDIYCEWPLAATTTQAREMVQLAKQHNCRTIIGLQGRVAPSILKIKSLIDSGRLGDIHSVNFQGAINVWQNNAAGYKYHYFMDRKVGGNLLTIYGGHILDSILFAVGELKKGSYSTMLGNLRPRMKRTQEDGSVSEEEFEKDTPDQILLQGRLERVPEAVFSFHLRAGDRFLGSPGSIWRVYGTKGELAVEFASAGPQIARASSVRFSNCETGEVEEIEVEEGGEVWTGLPTQGQNIGRLYEAFAEGGEGGFGKYADWEVALRRHELIDEFWAGGFE